MSHQWVVVHGARIALQDLWQQSLSTLCILEMVDCHDGLFCRSVEPLPAASTVADEESPGALHEVSEDAAQ